MWVSRQISAGFGVKGSIKDRLQFPSSLFLNAESWNYDDCAKKSNNTSISMKKDKKMSDMICQTTSVFNMIQLASRQTVLKITYPFVRTMMTDIDPIANRTKEKNNLFKRDSENVSMTSLSRSSDALSHAWNIKKHRGCVCKSWDFLIFFFKFQTLQSVGSEKHKQRTKSWVLKCDLAAYLMKYAVHDNRSTHHSWLEVADFNLAQFSSHMKTPQKNVQACKFGMQTTGRESFEWKLMVSLSWTNTSTDLDYQMELMLDVAFAIPAQRHIDSKGLGKRESFVKLCHFNRVDVYELRFIAAFDVDYFLPKHVRHQFSDNIIFDLHHGFHFLKKILFHFTRKMGTRSVGCD